MTRKPKKVAPTVTKTTDSPKVPMVVPSEQPKEAPSPAMPIDLSKLDPKKVKMAEDLGIPVGQIINWMGTVEARFNAIQEQMPQQIQQAMEQAIQNAQQRQREEYVKAAKEGRVPQGGGGGGFFGALLEKAVLGGGGGADEEMMQLTKDMMKLNMESIRTDISFSKALKNALVSKVAGKAIGEAAKNIIE